MEEGNAAKKDPSYLQMSFLQAEDKNSEGKRKS